jgi:hypothetical protein
MPFLYAKEPLQRNRRLADVRVGGEVFALFERGVPLA